jgi:hypothetical protein
MFGMEYGIAKTLHAILGLITVSTVFNFCFCVAGELSSSCACFMDLFMVVVCCAFYFSDDIS